MCSYMKVEAISINVILNYDVTYVTYIVNPIKLTMLIFRSYRLQVPTYQSLNRQFSKHPKLFSNIQSAEAFPWAILLSSWWSSWSGSLENMPGAFGAPAGSGLIYCWRFSVWSRLKGKSPGFSSGF